MIKITVSKMKSTNIDALIKSKQRDIMKVLVTKLKEATPVDTGRARDGWIAEDNVIKNEVEYIDHLNQGSSKQAPSHFVEKTLLTQEGVYPSGTIVRSI